MIAQHFQTALALHRDGRLSEAEHQYRLVLAAEPAHFETLNNLGLLLARQGRMDEALALTRLAAAQNPRSAETLSNLGRMLGQAGQHEEALAQFEKSLAVEPANAQTLARFSAALRAQDRGDEAIPRLERAIALQPLVAETHHMLGGLLYGVGRLDEARRSFETAVKLRPNGHYYRDLATATRFAPGDPHLTAMEALLRKSAAMPASEQMALHFALAKAYADLGSHAISFRHQLEANRLRRQQTAYDEVTTLTMLETMRRAFTPEFLRARVRGGDPSEVPVFIVGMPRSGTTLVEQILASHLDVLAVGESLAFETCVTAELGAAASAEAISAARPDQLRAIGAAYLASVSRARPDALRIVDKMQANFLFAGLIHLVFPNARIVHVMRDAVDTCLSCFAHEFPAGAPYLYDLGELGRYYRAYAGLMDHWRKVLPPDAMIEVKYEDVVLDLETQARRLVKHCGLEWNSTCLSFDKSDRPVWTASAAQVRQPIYTSSVGRWRPGAETIAPLLEALGT